MSYVVHWEDKGIHVQFEGSIGQVDAGDVMLEVTHNVRFAGLRYAIVDLLLAEVPRRAPTTADGTRAVLSVVVEACRSNSRLLVATVLEDARVLDTARDVARAAGVHTRHETFPSVADARKWIAKAQSGSAERA